VDIAPLWLAINNLHLLVLDISPLYPSRTLHSFRMADGLDVKDEHHNGHEEGVDDEVFTASSLNSTLSKQLGA
jgi:hypothetical protein